MRQKTSEALMITQIQAYLGYSKIVAEAVRQEVNNECSEKGMLRSSYFIYETRKRVIAKWHDEVLAIYRKIAEMPIKNEEQAGRIKKEISDCTWRDSGLAAFDNTDFATMEGEKLQFYEFLQKEYIQVTAALHEGHSSILYRLQRERRERFRLYFTMLFGAAASVVGVLIGALIS